MKINADKIYVCHYSKLIDRKQLMIDQFNKLNIKNYEFVELYDKNSWNINDISKIYPMINHPSTNLTDGEKSLTLKHVWIIRNMYENNYSSVLVLEDDAILCDNFVEKYNQYILELPEFWDIGWVGSCFNLREPQKPNIYIYKTDRGSRCTHAFCISKYLAKKVYEEVLNVNMASDHYYNYLVKKFNLENYWFQPPLATQSLNHPSSLTGKYWHESIVN